MAEATYMKLYFPGTVVDTHVETMIKGRTPPLDLPARAFAYELYERTSVEVEIDGAFQAVHGKPRNVTMHFIEGNVYSLEEVRKNLPSEHTLLANMIGNRYSHVVCARGSWRAFNPDKDRRVDKAGFVDKNV